MASHEDDDFDALLEKSSLGGSAARRLRERTPLSRARTVHRIIELRNQIAHPGEALEQAAQTDRELLHQLKSMDHRATAEASEERPCAAPNPVSEPNGSADSAYVRRGPATALAMERAQHVGTAVVERDRAALAEIELCGDLIIAASTADEDRLSMARIDEVLGVRANHEGKAASPGT